MKPSKDQIRSNVFESLKELSQKDSKGVALRDDTNPIDALALDSELGIHFALSMQDKLGIKIPDEVNPFVIDGPAPRARTIGQIIELLERMAKEQQAEAQ